MLEKEYRLRAAGMITSKRFPRSVDPGDLPAPYEPIVQRSNLHIPMAMFVRAVGSDAVRCTSTRT